MLEVRAGTGGDEAALFAGDLLRMYQRFAETQGWRFELISASASEVGGYKEAIASINGAGVFAKLKFESGVHRVQRVPVTESGGRIHTSAATVAVLPEAEDVDVQIDDKDLRIDVYRSSGPGGQSVNTTDSAVRITHLPTGLVVIQQDEKSQHKNKAKALKVLRTRLFELERERLASERAGARKSMVGSGDRSERIRTYNFPQGRVTDHRINLTLHKLDEVLEGRGLTEIDRRPGRRGRSRAARGPGRSVKPIARALDDAARQLTQDQRYRAARRRAADGRGAAHRPRPPAPVAARPRRCRTRFWDDGQAPHRRASRSPTSPAAALLEHRASRRPGRARAAPGFRSADRLGDRAFRRHGRRRARILDLGTGPGTLLLAALDIWPDATGLGIDLSRQALSYASANARRLGFEARAQARCRAIGPKAWSRSST